MTNTTTPRVGVEKFLEIYSKPSGYFQKILNVENAYGHCHHPHHHHGFWHYHHRSHQKMN